MGYESNESRVRRELYHKLHDDAEAMLFCERCSKVTEHKRISIGWMKCGCGKRRKEPDTSSVTASENGFLHQRPPGYNYRRGR